MNAFLDTFRTADSSFLFQPTVPALQASPQLVSNSAYRSQPVRDRRTTADGPTGDESAVPQYHPVDPVGPRSPSRFAAAQLLSSLSTRPPGQSHLNSPIKGSQSLINSGAPASFEQYLDPPTGMRSVRRMAEQPLPVHSPFAMPITSTSTARIQDLRGSNTGFDVQAINASDSDEGSEYQSGLNSAALPDDEPPPAKKQRTSRGSSKADAGLVAKTPRTAPIKRKDVLTDDQKRQNHINSEKRRRDEIKTGIKNLVELLQAGESSSGIYIGADDGNDEMEDGSQDESGKKKVKPKAKSRGRGRKSEAGAGASKATVLTQAVRYLHWLEDGNTHLQREVERVEAIAQAGPSGFSNS